MKKISSLILLLIIISCKSSKDVNISDSSGLIQWSISDKNLLNNVEKFQNENLKDDKDLAFVIIEKEDVNKEFIDEYIISSHHSITNIYTWPISFYIIHKGRPILFYFKNGPFVNPRNYPLHIVKNEFQKFLQDDWFRYYDQKTKEVVGGYIISTYHPRRWHFKDGKLNFEVIGEPLLSKIIYGLEMFNYTHIDNMDNYRTDYTELRK
jgi:hypothetical protein